jgi:hypothetical protein
MKAITSLADRFTSDEWRAYRKHSAAVIKAHRHGQSVNLAKDVPVLGFFENMAHLVRRGVLDKEMVWNKFGWYITRYFLGLTSDGNLIAQNRISEGDQTLWEEFEWLNREMLRIYRRRGIDIENPELTASRINELLEQEVNLTNLLDPFAPTKVILTGTQQ